MLAEHASTSKRAARSVRPWREAARNRPSAESRRDGPSSTTSRGDPLATPPPPVRSPRGARPAGRGRSGAPATRSDARRRPGSARATGREPAPGWRRRARGPAAATARGGGTRSGSPPRPTRAWGRGGLPKLRAAAQVGPFDPVGELFDGAGRENHDDLESLTSARASCPLRKARRSGGFPAGLAVRSQEPKSAQVRDTDFPRPRKFLGRPAATGFRTPGRVW